MSARDSNNELSVWELMNIGSNLEVLRRVTAQTPIYQFRSGQLSVADRLRMLQQDLETLELAQSERVLAAEIDDLLRQIEDTSRPNRLGNDACRIRRIIKKVENALTEEGNRRKVFIALRDREGLIESLLSDPLQFFGISAEDILKLSPIGAEDFSEAARCYSVGFSAASIMFMLRATEEVLRSYYSHVTQQSANEKNWGSLLTVLRIPVLRCPPDLITLLDKLLKKRNAAMHPKKREPQEWDLDAAREILNECRRAIQMMLDDAKQRSSSPVVPYHT